MTGKEVIEGNNLIAEFIAVGVNTETGWLHFRHPEIAAAPSDYEYYRFEESWDWLIPVINKIYDLSGYYIYKYETQTFYSEGGIEINTKYIEETYKDVVEFIEWFNSNKK